MEWVETRGVSPCGGDKSSPWQGVYSDKSVSALRVAWACAGHWAQRAGRAVQAGCGPRAPAVVTSLAGSQGDTQDAPDPLGTNRGPLVSQAGQGAGGSRLAWVQTALGAAGHHSCDTEPWGNQSSAVPAVPSLERCAPLDRMQLLKEPSGPSLRWKRLAMDPVGYLHPSAKEPGPGGWRAPGPELAHHKQNKRTPSVPGLKQIMSLLPY